MMNSRINYLKYERESSFVFESRKDEEILKRPHGNHAELYLEAMPVSGVPDRAVFAANLVDVDSGTVFVQVHGISLNKSIIRASEKALYEVLKTLASHNHSCGISFYGEEDWGQFLANILENKWYEDWRANQLRTLEENKSLSNMDIMKWVVKLLCENKLGDWFTDAYCVEDLSGLDDTKQDWLIRTRRLVEEEANHYRIVKKWNKSSF